MQWDKPLLREERLMTLPQFPPAHGTPLMLEPDLRLVLAPNPSPMTYWGTNTYILGTDALAVIDPGPDSDAHLEALLACQTGGAKITHILVTHTHKDHSPLAARLSRETGAVVYAFGPAHAGESETMQALRATADVGGGEGIDPTFQPDHILADGDSLQIGDHHVTALWTPGHLSNHMCFASGDRLFSGDHVMEWATSLISPPDGDLAAFMASCRRLLEHDHRIYYPGHGTPVTAPRARVETLLAHRQKREGDILEQLKTAGGSAADLAARIYTDVDPALLPAASRNVLAHLIDLAQKGRVTHAAPLAEDTVFHVSENP